MISRAPDDPQAPAAAAAPEGAAGSKGAVAARLRPIGQPVLLAALYMVSAGFAVRLFATMQNSGLRPWYAALFAAFFVLFSLVWAIPRMPALWIHATIVLECAVAVGLLLLGPDFDYMTSLLILPAYQAAAVLSARVRWVWVCAILVIMLAAQTGTLGLRGVGLALTPMAVAIALAALATARRTAEEARTQSERLVEELEAKRRQLEQNAAEIEGLAGMDERNRLVRELHDSVSQAMFAVLLSARSGQLMVDKDPAGLPAHLESLRDLTQEALARMRGFIAELRSPEGR
jgi:signal transduction histidine kinase